MLRSVRLRCLIVDDNEPFLEVAAASLAGDELDVLGTATTSAEALRQVAEQQPDVVLVDINFGGLIKASPAVGFVRKTQLSAQAVRELVASRSPSDREGT